MPTEFRLFVSGWNETENGRFLFDADAAASVIQTYRAWGVDLAIDLEHQMLVKDIAPDPTAKDARGWCGLELRADGSLWAVHVKWTADGAARLSERRQRYISPAFEVDDETGRVMAMINMAITAIPATHDTPALISASRRLVKTLSVGGSLMDPELIKKALAALESGDAGSALEILKELIASAAGAPPDEPEETPAPAAEMSAAPEEPKPEELSAAGARLQRLSGRASFIDALAEAEVWRASHIALETERKTLAKERATLESAERRKLAVELVTLGAEFPATVWADDKASRLKPRWLAMDLAEFRSHVAEQRSARGGKASPAPRSPATSDSAVTLSAREITMCTDMKVDPKVYAARKALNKKAV